MGYARPPRPYLDRKTHSRARKRRALGTYPRRARQVITDVRVTHISVGPWGFTLGGEVLARRWGLGP